jgi:hypothetical protein
MLRIQNRHVDWEHHQIAIPGAHAKDSENRRVPFDPHGRLAASLKRRSRLGPSAFVFGGPDGEFQACFRTAWESLLLRAKVPGRTAGSTVRSSGRSISTGTTCATKRLSLARRRRRHPHHPADARPRRHQQTQRYLNITDEELRRAMTGVWERRRQLRLSASSGRPGADDLKASGQ